ncbi:hypothetical protein FHW12_001033 [Dokdonella fugitiva]|uniref:Uncharacterized protein n=1 Tax=Dokdonella fugitiva TaxID=328517 RepID=A0A839EYM4_9GAMM|nr:hypothetical protein [Dokdonella fugitiva]
MHTPWIPSSIALPHEGQPVEFVLDHRQIAIEGTYTRQVFRSRWTSYEVERVGTWRLADLLHARDHAAA